jgi:hypothetical protein
MDLLYPSLGYENSILPQKCWYASTRLHGMTSEKTVISLCGLLSAGVSHVSAIGPAYLKARLSAWTASLYGSTAHTAGIVWFFCKFERSASNTTRDYRHHVLFLLPSEDWTNKKYQVRQFASELVQNSASISAGHDRAQRGRVRSTQNNGHHKNCIKTHEATSKGLVLN